MEENHEKAVSMPRIGDAAPKFKAVTTQGDISFPEDYAGEWVILFSHPADFTPVCTSEFMTFANMEDKFTDANCKLVGLSVDGLYSHIAWLRTIKEKIEYKGMKDVEAMLVKPSPRTPQEWNDADAHGFILKGKCLAIHVFATFDSTQPEFDASHAHTNTMHMLSV